jgi:hypothetical protein
MIWGGHWGYKSNPNSSATMRPAALGYGYQASQL